VTPLPPSSEGAAVVRGARAAAAGRALAIIAAWATFAGAPPGGRASALSAAEDPAGRGVQLLQARESALASQAGQAAQTARHRGRMLYRLLLHASVERRNDATGGGSAATSPPSPGPGGRAISLGVAVLARDLEEAAALRDELARVRAERTAAEAALADGASGGPEQPANALHAPVPGPITTSWGVARDGATGGWLFHTSAGYSPKPGTPVVAAADGRVARVAEDVGGGWALVIAHDGGLTTVLGGLASVAVEPRQSIRAGATVGTAGPAVRFEVSRHRVPLDPAPLVTATGAHAQRGGVPRLPGRTR
jgi:murein DD-endopeptidase MepM/ murein hydrolase activator NlpD